MSTIAESVRVLDALEHLEHLGLHGHVEGGGRLVGDEQVGVVGDRHGDHDPLAHAAGELVRVLVDPLLRLRDADQVEQLDRPRRRLLLLSAVVHLRTASAIWPPTVNTGLSAVSGSWKIIAISPPRTAPHPLRLGGEQVLALPERPPRR